MVGTGLLMLAVSWSAAWFLWRRQRAAAAGRLCAGADGAVRLGRLLAGWYTTEIGRQPWLVTGILKTADALGPVPGGHVALTLAVYLVLYVLLILAFLGVLVRLSLKAAKEGEPRRCPACATGRWRNRCRQGSRMMVAMGLASSRPPLSCRTSPPQGGDWPAAWTLPLHRRTLADWRNQR